MKSILLFLMMLPVVCFGQVGIKQSCGSLCVETHPIFTYDNIPSMNVPPYPKIKTVITLSLTSTKQIATFKSDGVVIYATKKEIEDYIKSIDENNIDHFLAVAVLEIKRLRDKYEPESKK